MALNSKNPCSTTAKEIQWTWFCWCIGRCPLTKTNSSSAEPGCYKGFHHRSLTDKHPSASNVYNKQTRLKCCSCASLLNKDVPVSVGSLQGYKKSSQRSQFVPRWLAEQHDKLLLWCDSALALSLHEAAGIITAG